jgi:hypothetical protein
MTVDHRRVGHRRYDHEPDLRQYCQAVNARGACHNIAAWRVRYNGQDHLLCAKHKWQWQREGFATTAIRIRGEP